jgi:hypothetical protein
MKWLLEYEFRFTMNSYIDCGSRAAQKRELHLVAGNDARFFAVILSLNRQQLADFCLFATACANGSSTVQTGRLFGWIA